MAVESPEDAEVGRDMLLYLVILDANLVIWGTQIGFDGRRIILV